MHVAPIACKKAVCGRARTQYKDQRTKMIKVVGMVKVIGMEYRPT